MRFVLSIVVFVLIPLEQYLAAMIVFVHRRRDRLDRRLVGPQVSAR